MYDELVKRLRNCSTEAAPCKTCGMTEDGSCSDTLMKQAADAIEKLTAYVALYKDGGETAMKVANDYKARIEELQAQLMYSNDVAKAIAEKVPKWIPVDERLPSDFVSVQAHMTDAGNFPPVREAYVVNKNWFFPALKEFHPVNMWKRFDEPPEEE